MWSEAIQLKREQLEDLISQVSNPTLKANMLHTLSKLMMFASEDKVSKLSEGMKLTASQSLRMYP